MKTFKSMPHETAFFDRYANLIHSLTKFATVAQWITGMAEIGIIYSLLYPSFSDLFPSMANPLSITGSLFAASILQVGLKKVFPYSVRAILFKRFKGLDLAFSIAVFVLTIALLSVSVLLSYKGSHDIIDIAIAPPTEKTTVATDSTKAATERQANATFTTDSATIETKYLGKAEAIQSEYQSRIETAERQAANSRTASPAWSKELSAKANGIKAELKTKLATLQSDKASEIEAKATERKATINRATDKNDQATAQILSDNNESKTKTTERKGRYKNYVGYFTLFCYVFFLIAFILDEIYKKGAKIDETPMPHQRHFLPSLFAEWVEAIKARFDTWLRSKIYAYSDKTKASPLPNALNSLYDFKADTLKNVWTIESEPQETKVIKLPSKPLRIAAKATEEMGVTKIVGGAEKQEKRYTIGFKKEASNDSNDTENSTITKIVGGTEMTGQCPNCMKSFTKNHKKHTYCTDECRVQFWEKANGKKVHKNKAGKS